MHTQCKPATWLAVAMVALALAIPAAAQQPNRISITTGGTGGVYYPLGGGLANVLSKTIPGLQATAEVTGGSVDNLKLINSGGSDGWWDIEELAVGHDQIRGRFRLNGLNRPTLLIDRRNGTITVDGMIKFNGRCEQDSGHRRF